MAEDIIKVETDHIEDFLPCEVERITYLVCDRDTREILAEVGSSTIASCLVRLGVAANGSLEVVPCVRATMTRKHFLECKMQQDEDSE